MNYMQSLTATEPKLIQLYIKHKFTPYRFHLHTCLHLGYVFIWTELQNYLWFIRPGATQFS
jgi:hypothetical protein